MRFEGIQTYKNNTNVDENNAFEKVIATTEIHYANLLVWKAQGLYEHLCQGRCLIG